MIILESGNPAQKKQWLDTIERDFAGEPMLLPAYIELFCGRRDKAVCACCITEHGVIAYPFILRVVPEGDGAYDIASAYGYGGPLISGVITDCEKLQFWEEFEDYAHKLGIVAEFIRFMLGRESECAYPGEYVARTSNVIRNLNISLGQMWMEFEHKVRKNVNKANLSGLEMVIDNGERIDDFMRIYYATMDRSGAERGYYFDKDFFEKVHREMTGHYGYFYVLKDGISVSAELVLYGRDTMYSYLGGTLIEAFAMRPNDLLKYEIIKWGKEHEINNYILGGGYDHDDGIFRYKKSLAPSGVVRFYTGQRIFDRIKYNTLVKNRLDLSVREGNHPVTGDETGYFPLYRE